MHIAVTGASGFVGRRLIHDLVEQGHQVSAFTRSHASEVPKGAAFSANVDLAGRNAGAALRRMLIGVEAVVHLAAKTHSPGLDSPRFVEAYNAANVDATRCVVSAAVDCRVRRFIFLSSIKVNGERTYLQPFHHTDVPRPLDNYGRSKHAAEMVIEQLCSGSDTTYHILRAPLVYGPDVKGNVRKLMSLVRRGIPLPFGGLTNRRNLLGLRNLCSGIEFVLSGKAEANAVYLLSDHPAQSTTRLLCAIGRGLRRDARLVPIPRLVGNMLGTRFAATSAITKLYGSLEIDVSAGLQRDGWTPPFGFGEQIDEMCFSYLQGGGS